MKWRQHDRTFYLSADDDQEIRPWVFIVYYWEASVIVKPYDSTLGIITVEDAEYWLAHPDERYMQELL